MNDTDCPSDVNKKSAIIRSPKSIKYFVNLTNPDNVIYAILIERGWVKSDDETKVGLNCEIILTFMLANLYLF